MIKLRQRIIAGILSLGILFTMVPLNVFAGGILYGDVNRSGSVNQEDADDLKKHLAEYDIDIDAVAADVNRDNKVDLMDLLLIEKYLAGFDVTLGNNVKITFDTDGGTPVDSVMLCNGAVLSDYMPVPETEKENYIFLGWLKQDGSPFYAEEPITTSLRLRASFAELQSDVLETPQSYALEDASPNLSFEVVTTEDSTPGNVLAGITLLTKDGSDPVELKVTQINSKHFRVSAESGFIPGCTYELVLEDGLNFKDKAESIRKATFIIKKDETDKLAYNDDIKYIKDTDSISYTITSSGTPTVVPVLDLAIIRNEDDGIVSGWFTYSPTGLNVGDTLCIYENVDPRELEYDKSDYEGNAVAYVKITAIEGSTIYFRGVDETEIADVLFIPDTLPFKAPTLPSGNNIIIENYQSYFDTEAWSFMGRSDQPQIDIGDFVVIYSGNFEDITADSPVYFGQITSINGGNLSIKKTTPEAIKAVNELFLSKPMDGDTLLDNIDVDSLEKNIAEQA